MVFQGVLQSDSKVNTVIAALYCMEIMDARALSRTVRVHFSSKGSTLTGGEDLTVSAVIVERYGRVDGNQY